MKPKLRFADFSDDYIESKLKNYVEVYDGTHETPNYVDSGIKFVSVENIKNLLNSDKYIPEIDFDKYKIKEKYNDVFMTRIGDIGTSTIYKSNEPLAYYVSLALLRSKNESVLYPDYLNQYISNQDFQKELHDRTIHVAFPKKINTGEIGECNIIIPSYKEQIKVSNFLSLIDKKIELQSKKIEDLKLFKLYTKNQLFRSGEKVVKLKDILNKWNEKNKDGSIKYVESISNKYGFISQSDQFEDRNIASKDLKNYYVIRKNVFGYNPSRLNVGSLALKENDNTSVVSPLYECFTTTQNNKFMLEWFDSKYFKKGTLSKFEGGVRNTLNFTNLCEIEINLPTLDKQNEFANYLYNFDKKIQLEELKLNKLNEMKKGLMQNMFV